MQTTSHSLWFHDPSAWPWAPNSELGWPWSSLEVIRETGSTNADLVAAARAGAESGKVLVSDHQTSGRGRLDRTWTAPPGTSLAISVLLRPPDDVPATRWTWLPLVAGIAVRDALKSRGRVPATVKWPNDVLIDDRKVAGILSERVGDAVVIGMGINTRLSVAELPVPTATSLALAGAEVSDVAVLRAVIGKLGDWYRRWLDGEDLVAALTTRCSTIGRQVRVELPGGTAATGTATGVDADGRLLVSTAGGLRPFAAGDVVHLR